MRLIISGLSGAGKSTALHALEDLGCFCTDNLPLELLGEWGRLLMQRDKPMAVCVDARSAQVQALQQTFHDILQGPDQWRMIFLDATDQSLLRRFSTLRRRHPYMPEADLPHAIAAERQALCEVRDLADLVLDTSLLNPYELSSLVESFWQRSQEHEQTPEVTVSLISFSYRNGLPLDADMVVDVRFLPNPHYEADLVALTGKDEPVQRFLGEKPEAIEVEQRLRDWFRFLWGQLKHERKQYFTLAIGCSGGRHRSVYMVERLAAWMQQENLTTPLVRHRELSS